MRFSRLVVLAALVAACGDDSDPTSPSNRQLPEGTYTATWYACTLCDNFTTAGNILTFKDGEDVTFSISDVTPDTAIMTILASDVIGWFDTTTIVLEYGEHASTEGPAYRGAVRYSSSTTIFPIFFRDGDGIDCSLGFFDPRYDTTPQRCEMK